MMMVTLVTNVHQVLMTVPMMDLILTLMASVMQVMMMMITTTVQMT